MKAGWDINEIYAVAESPNVLLIKPPVFPALGAVLRNSCSFSSHQPSPAAQPWHCSGTHREGRQNSAFHGKLGKTGENNSLELVCREAAGAERARARPEQAGICPRREHAAFYKANLAEDFQNVPCFSALCWCTVRSKGLKSFQKPSLDPAGLKWPSPLPRPQYS